MIEKNMQARLETKTLEQQFIYVLENDFQFAPKIAEVILAEAKASIGTEVEPVPAGQIRVVLATRQAGHGRALRETETIRVRWTVDVGDEDRQVWRRHGSKALRQVRIQRLLLEAVEQGAAATQEDLAQALNVSVRTIKRDFEELEAEGMYLPSRVKLMIRLLCIPIMRSSRYSVICAPLCGWLNSISKVLVKTK